jgi:hypothetical protein
MSLDGAALDIPKGVQRVSIKVGLEFHPENGNAPHVIVTHLASGVCLWIAKRSRQEAEDHLPNYAFMVGQQWGDPVETVPPVGY